MKRIEIGTARGERSNDNRDNFRGNQYPCRDEDKLNQQLKQLYLTTLRSQQHSSRSGLLFKRQF
jgi:hypothetical protein